MASTAKSQRLRTGTRRDEEAPGSVDTERLSYRNKILTGRLPDVSIDLDSLKHGPSGFTTDHDTLTERPSIPMIELGFSTVEFSVKYEGEGNSFTGTASK